MLPTVTWPYTEILLRLGLGLALGLLIGLERERRRKEAGLRTFAFIAMDDGPEKKVVFEKLEAIGASFIDVGMGLSLDEMSLGGILRTTASTPKRRDVARDRGWEIRDFRTVRKAARIGVPSALALGAAGGALAAVASRRR